MRPCPLKKHNWVTDLIARFYCRRRDRRHAYALYDYFRTLDDYVDDPGIPRRDKTEYLRRQYALIRGLYQDGKLADADPIAEVVRYDCRHGLRLEPNILRMFRVFDFDEARGGHTVTRQELAAYSRDLALSYLGIFLNFIEPRYQFNEDDVQLAYGCHQVHMLRDHFVDLSIGYINLADEEMREYGIRPGGHVEPGFRNWVRQKVREIEGCLTRGKERVMSAPFLKVKLAAFLYCFRYEVVLRRLKESDYLLRKDYPVRAPDLIRLAAVLLGISAGHVAGKFRRGWI